VLVTFSVRCDIILLFLRLTKYSGLGFSTYVSLNFIQFLHSELPVNYEIVKHT